MSKIIFGFVGVAVLGLGAWYFTSNAQNEEAKAMAEKAAMDEKAMMEKEKMLETDEMDDAAMADKSMDKAMMKDDASDKAMDTMKKDEMDTMKKDEMEKTAVTDVEAGMYAPYEEAKLAMAKTGDVVLFFKAGWCPSCRALDSDIKNNLGSIPADLTILEVDYDNSSALKQKYGVTTQHTLVQVDESGKLLNKWSGSPKLVDLVAKVQ